MRTSRHEIVWRPTAVIRCRHFRFFQQHFGVLHSMMSSAVFLARPIVLGCKVVGDGPIRQCRLHGDAQHSTSNFITHTFKLTRRDTHTVFSFPNANRQRPERAEKNLRPKALENYGFQQEYDIRMLYSEQQSHMFLCLYRVNGVGSRKSTDALIHRIIGVIAIFHCTISSSCWRCFPFKFFFATSASSGILSKKAPGVAYPQQDCRMSQRASERSRHKKSVTQQPDHAATTKNTGETH